MPINVNDPEYVKAEKDYDTAQTLEERITALKKMISHMPGHKGAEKLRAQLKSRYKRLSEQLIKAKKSGKGTQVGIKKEDMQGIFLGLTNTGKSTILSLLTNAEPKISEIKFSTTEPVIGMMNHNSVSIQLIENPAIEGEYYNRGLTNTADTLLLVINNLDEIETIKKELSKASGKQIIIYNDKKILSQNKKRKLKATLQSKKYNFIIINPYTNEGIDELREKIFQSFDNIRIFTKEPGKEKTDRPIIMKPNSTVEDAAEKILKGFSKKVVETRITGPSAKFVNQKVGLKHKLKDLDVIEFKTR